MTASSQSILMLNCLHCGHTTLSSTRFGSDGVTQNRNQLSGELRHLPTSPNHNPNKLQ